MADPLTDGQIAEWRRYLDQGDWHQLVTDDEFRALLDTAAEVARLRGEVERLQGEVHDCPVCHRVCKEYDCTEQRIATLTAERDEALAAARKAGEQRDAAVKVLESIRDHVCVEPCKRCQEGAKIIVAAIRNLPLGKGDVS